MMKISDLRHKDVIDSSSGKRLGFVRDIEINLEKGCIEALVIPEESRFFTLFGKSEETVLRWRQLKKIGVDVILIEAEPSAPANPAADSEDRATGQRRGPAHPLDEEFDRFDVFEP